MMLSDQIRILNFDDSIINQKELIQQYNPKIVHLKYLGPYCRLALNSKQVTELIKSINPHDKHDITFLGSGDFHHVSAVLIEQFIEPITVIVFDHHPDWDLLPPKLGYGSWITYTLSNPNIEKIILIGVSSHDISTWSIQTGNLQSIEQNRLEIYTYQHQPTFTFFKTVPQNSATVTVEDKMLFKKLYWRSIRKVNFNHLFFDILSRINSSNVYISVDKDCLKSEYSLTNWEEGLLSLDELLQMLKIIKDNLNIVGMDITGDYSMPDVRGWFNAFLYQSDHSAHFSAFGKNVSVIDSVNQKTNMQILNLFLNNRH